MNELNDVKNNDFISNILNKQIQKLIGKSDKSHREVAKELKNQQTNEEKQMEQTNKKLDKFYTEEDYYLNNDGSQVLETRMGFEWKDFFITEPFSSECGRFEVDPTKYYGITKDEADMIEKYNTIRCK